MKQELLVNVIDVEATCWEPKNSQPRDEVSEIIEIGISVVDLTHLSILTNESILVKPQASKVSKFCTQLTTLTQEQVDRGVTYKQACEILQNEYDSRNRTFVSWGDYDRRMFQDSAKFFGVKYPFGPRHHNLKNSFAMLYGLQRELGLDAALAHIGLPLEGTHHRGNWDALNIAKIFISVVKQFRDNGR